MATAVPSSFEAVSERETPRAPAGGSLLRGAATGGLLWIGAVFVLAVLSNQGWLADFLAH